MPDKYSILAGQTEAKPDVLSIMTVGADKIYTIFTAEPLRTFCLHEQMYTLMLIALFNWSFRDSVNSFSIHILFMTVEHQLARPCLLGTKAERKLDIGSLEPAIKHDQVEQHA